MSSKLPTQMDRSPSHESVTTDLSLLSLSSLNSDKTKVASQWTHPTVKTKITTDDVDLSAPSILPIRRSPTPLDGGTHRLSGGSRNALLQIPGEQRGRSSVSPRSSTVKTVNQVIFEEESDFIKSCGVLLSALGLSKSFSTGDICRLLQNEEESTTKAVSESALNDWNPKFDFPQLGLSAGRPLDCASRSCSTWVAVGDAMSSTSQLPSPQALPGSLGENVGFSAADFVRSVNKKVRQNYIRGRILSTYRVLQRFNQSSSPSTSVTNVTTSNNPTVTVTTTPSSTTKEQISKILNNAPVSFSTLNFRNNSAKPLSLKDVEKDKGKPLTKYDRNMMIFSWLQNLDESSFDKFS